LFLIGQSFLIFSSETTLPNKPKLAIYQISVHLGKLLQRRRLKKISQSETKMACGGHVC
jgi:hypothetical protein